ncbi:serine/threonine-protein kinase, partial [Kitasatospora sp. NPDC050543]|uniref:serine/threonine-protein kinase n=1 Tax=Kitasatospora sp. NPDC050543 TaxID=3364054 RepID=UPI0037913C88
SEHPEHLYLADFGLTKKSLSLSGLTTVGQIVGTLAYAAPEQISGWAVDGRCDLYSLACVVFEMLAGVPPFRQDGDLALLWAHLNEPAPPLAAHRPDLPPAMDTVLATALAKAPDDRYDTCLEFVAALRTAAAEEPPHAQQCWQSTGPPTELVPALAQGPYRDASEPRPRAAAAAGVPEPPAWAMPVFDPGSLPSPPPPATGPPRFSASG